MVRAKIKVEKVTQFDHGDQEVTFRAVYKDDPGHENKSFWKYTPSMNFSMLLSKEATGAIAFFRAALEQGTELYLDFSEAPPS